MRITFSLALCAALAACGGDGKTDGDTGTDAPVDAPVDGAPDAPEDPGTDTDACDGCMEGLECCAGRCVNLSYDPAHCGACDAPCTGDPAYCDGGTCSAPPCDTTCTGEGELCCGESCCAAGQICCVVVGGPLGPPTCHDDVCPGGCPLCP